MLLAFKDLYEDLSTPPPSHEETRYAPESRVYAGHRVTYDATDLCPLRYDIIREWQPGEADQCHFENIAQYQNVPARDLRLIQMDRDAFDVVEWVCSVVSSQAGEEVAKGDEQDPRRV